MYCILICWEFVFMQPRINQFIKLLGLHLSLESLPVIADWKLKLYTNAVNASELSWKV